MKLLSFAALALASNACAYASDDKSYLAILAETKVMKIAGMPAMPSLPAGFKLPGGRAMPQMPGQPSRSLNIRLWSPSIAPDNAFAYVVPPSGLQQGDKLNLELYRPKPEQTTADEGGVGDMGPMQNPDFTIKIYWGSSETVRDGQPKIIKWGGLTSDQQEAMKKQAAAARRNVRESLFYKPNWTTGYWPAGSEQGQISSDASLFGTFALSTNYTGNVSIDAPKNVDFLAPYDLSSPSLDAPIDLTSFIPLKWSPISNLVGQVASAFGMEGKNTIIIWSSSEVYVERMMADSGFMQMAEVKALVDKTEFMPGDATSCTIPAGIFKDTDMAMGTLAGYGNGTALDNVQPIPRIQTKTTMTLMFGMMGRNRRGQPTRGQDNGEGG